LFSSHISIYPPNIDPAAVFVKPIIAFFLISISDVERIDNMSRSIQEDSDLVEVLQKHSSDRLTEWEEGFLSSIEKRLDEGVELTEKQGEALDKIWRRVMG